MLTIPQLRELFEAYLDENALTQAPQSLYDPVNYIMQLGGKRMRPVLSLLAYQLFDEDVKQALPAALSVETFHNFSLVHDDIMDAADLRRGKTTVHKKYDTNTAILSGDVMLIYAYSYLQNTPNKEVVNEMTKVLSEVAIKVCEGQQYDVDFETDNTITLVDYTQMIEMKTAVLLAASLELGALAAGASEENRKHLAEFGRLTGIAFQIQDDYLDTYGDAEKFGKKIGGDIAQNKKTCLYIKALELASADVKNELIELYNTAAKDEQAKIDRVTAIFTALGIPDDIKALRNAYQAQAYEHLDKVVADKAAKQLLSELADSLLIREL